MAIDQKLGRTGQRVRVSNGRPQNREEIADHLWGHVEYPTTRMGVLNACSRLACLSIEEDKRWLEVNLYDGTYRNAREVESALGL